ncbi:MAG: hypothetical protein ABH821_05600 [archaeon]
MKARGLLSFVILFLFIGIALSLAESQNLAEKKKAESMSFLLAGEKLNFEKTIIEQELDYFFNENLKELSLETNSAIEIKRRLNDRLKIKLNEINAEFMTGKVNPADYRQIMKAEGKTITIEKLNELNEVLVVRLKENVILTKFSFTGGIKKDEIVYALLENNKAITFAALPVNYTVTVVTTK